MNETGSPPLRDPLDKLARKLRPDLAAFKSSERITRVIDVLGILFAAPQAIIGIAWLIAATDLGIIEREWKLFLLMGALMLALNKLRFFFIANLNPGGGVYGNAEAVLDGIVRWSAMLLFGPTTLWIDLILNGSGSSVSLTRQKSIDLRWKVARETTFAITSASLYPLLAFQVYRGLGGPVPLASLTFENLLQGMGMLLTQLGLEGILLGLGYLAYPLWALRILYNRRMLVSVLTLSVLGLGVSFISNLFALPLAAAYSRSGLLAYLVLVLGTILVAIMGRRFSQAMEDSRQQNVQLEKLEALGRAILAAPPDESSLPAILAEHAPAMFTLERMGIWLEPDRILLKKPDNWPGKTIESIRTWMRNLPPAETRAYAFPANKPLPWAQDSKRNPAAIIAPILDVEDSGLIGGIYVSLVELGRGWNQGALDRMLPSVQSLAAQVASAIQQARIYKRSLAQQKTQQELAVARRIQLNFLPKELPKVPGWELAASLDPAREVAGDFYDLIPLPGGKLGILIADVADKGVGPALFMALSRTLIRTFALQNEDHPDKVLEAANRRIIQDAGETLFVTVFYGILDPNSGQFNYANAGHNPPCLFRAGNPPLTLGATGMPLGIEEMAHWRQGSAQIAPGEVLLLYTDGVTEAQNPDGEFYGPDRLMLTAGKQSHLCPAEIHAALLENFRAFIGDVPQSDDITLILVKRL